MTGSAQTPPIANQASPRFDIVVLNCGLIDLFLDNFHKLQNFDPTRDRIVVQDCSKDGAAQRQLVENFARERGWELGGPQVVFHTRENWGIDQGSRIDLLSSMHDYGARAPYVWQFQEHFLDTTSSYCRYPANVEVLGGLMKEDILPDDLSIDLDQCERAFADPEVSVVYAARQGLRIFEHTDGRSWFFSDGANLAFRTSTALSVFPRSQLDDYRLVFDASYRWAGFFEFEFGRCLSVGAWFDLATGRSFRDWAEVQAVERETGKKFGLPVDPRFVSWVDRYHRRLPRVRALPASVRKAMLKSTFVAAGAFQTHVFFPLRSKLKARGFDTPHWLRKIW